MRPSSDIQSCKCCAQNAQSLNESVLEISSINKKAEVVTLVRDNPHLTNFDKAWSNWFWLPTVCQSQKNWLLFISFTDLMLFMDIQMFWYAQTCHIAKVLSSRVIYDLPLLTYWNTF